MGAEDKDDIKFVVRAPFGLSIMLVKAIPRGKYCLVIYRDLVRYSENPDVTKCVILQLRLWWPPVVIFMGVIDWSYLLRGVK